MRQKEYLWAKGLIQDLWNLGLCGKELKKLKWKLQL